MATSTKTGLRTADLPTVDRVQFPDPAASRAWEQMRLLLDTRFGKGGQRLDKAVTWADLVENGLAKWRNSKGDLVSGPSGEFQPPVPPQPDGLPPPPTGFTVTPGLAMVYLEWEKPTFDYFGYAEVWRSTTNNQAQALLIGQTTNWVYADAVGAAGQTFYYWVRFVSTGGKNGPFNAVGGAQGSVSLDPAYLIDVLSADDPQALLWKVTDPTEINGVICQPGVYIRDLYLANGIIGNAQIGLAAVDDAKIKSLSAAKVTFGEMSGDRIATESLSADRLITNTLAAKLAKITEAYIGSANIKEAAIKSAHIDSLDAGKITSGFIGVDRLSPKLITSAKLADWLESDAKGPGGAPVLRLNFRTGEIQLNSATAGGGRMTLDNQLIQVFDANDVLRVRMGVW